MRVQYVTGAPLASSVDFANGLPFMYVDSAGVAHPRLDAADAPYTFMSVAAVITELVSIDMDARRQVKSMSSAWEPILNDYLAGLISGSVTNIYVYRSAFAKLYQATTLYSQSVSPFTTEPPQFVSADTLDAPARSFNTINGTDYYGYSMPAHTYWAADTPLVLEFTDSGDNSVKYLTIHSPATPYNNVAYTTMN